MADHPVDRPRSPVLIELCLLLRDFLGDSDLDARLADLTDADLYRHIAFAASLQHSGRDFTARPAPELDHVAAAVLRRLSTGSLGDTSLRSPQVRYATDATPRAVQVADGPAGPDKPVGALWTSSTLPDGTSMWQWGELAESGPDRPLSTVTFDPADVRLFTIDSPADYGRLVTRYPRTSDGRAQVCWTRAAEDLDAVHLTVPGLLTAHHVPVGTPHGTAILTGWDAESTAWLHLPSHLRTTPAARSAAQVPEARPVHSGRGGAGPDTGSIGDDPAEPSARARRFLASQPRSSPTAHDPDRYVCTDLDGRPVPGPDGGAARLLRFFARFGGLDIPTERPVTSGRYRFTSSAESGWEQVESGDWVARVGDVEGWELTLGWSTGRIGLDVVHPEAWIADSAVGLIESAALGQEIHRDGSWREAVPVAGRGPGWGLEIEVDRFVGVVAEVPVASSPWNRWFLDDDVAVHSWRETYNVERHPVVMAWYRNPRGRRRIEAVAGLLRAD